MLNSIVQSQFMLGSVLAFGVVIVSYRLRVLDLSGAITAFFLGAFIFGVGGWLFTIPLLLFFVLSSLLSRLLKAEKKDSGQIVAKGSRRDMKQVLANGFLPALVAISSLVPNEQIAFLLYLGGIAAATADTWATEIGMAFSAQPRSILTGKPVPAGTSGGVSVGGTLGAVVAALFIAFCGYILNKIWQITALSPIVFVIIALCAILAQVVDSLIGATLQRMNECKVCGKLTERARHCGQETHHKSGLKWLDNDAVNVACSFSGIFFTYIVVFYLLNL